jgi:hypothetical protein
MHYIPRVGKVYFGGQRYNSAEEIGRKQFPPHLWQLLATVLDGPKHLATSRSAAITPSLRTSR